MSDFKSATHMAFTLSEWGMEPSTIHSMVAYQFGHAPSLNKIKNFVDHRKEVDERRRARIEENMKPIGSLDEVHARRMKHSNEIFVRALWREIKTIQRRQKAHG